MKTNYLYDVSLYLPDRYGNTSLHYWSVRPPSAKQLKAILNEKVAEQKAAKPLAHCDLVYLSDLLPHIGFDEAIAAANEGQYHKQKITVAGQSIGEFTLSRKSYYV